MKIKSLCFAGVMSVFAADFAQASVCDFNVIQSQRTDASNIFNVCKREAQAGNTEAQFNLGFMYFSGIGVKQNFQDAAKWFLCFSCFPWPPSLQPMCSVLDTE